MKKIEAYQTSDGKKFLNESEAQSYENRLTCESKVEKIETYLYNLLGINILDPLENGGGTEEQLSNMFVDKGISGLWEDVIEEEALIELIIDIATMFNGALLKAARYARETCDSDKDNLEDNKKFDEIVAILLKYYRDISDGYDFDEDVEDMLRPIAGKIFRATQR